jgi:DNA-binding response OmpR family regulator
MAKRILIIDDDQYLRDLYEEILKESGFEIETAVDGKDALAVISKENFDLILLDIMMPKLDGIGFLKEFNKIPDKDKKGIVVILTNLAHDPIIKEGLSLGAKAYLIKADLNPDQLVDKVKSFL